ncbi:hypothetical protein GRS48_14795 [Halorubrum sp. JWXQ-INN 858]|uniref:DUF7311 family protein n=1 Tax=Halorubrum sp. JWXQ-INN 858 TaxID=2690782 RepID=UPI0013F81811|nr:hypothetical protein [Halorubrum sp. JWXQ-INN 858]MWV66077.1 hypothetical protein [Halorubrum sp. JWXQ-INN 858]
MIRAVLAVLVAVALLGVALPVLDDTRSATTTDRLDTGIERVEREAAALAAGSVAVADPTLAARTTVTVTVPTGLTAARVDRAVLGDPARIRGRAADAPATPVASDPPDVALGYRIAGEDLRVVPLSSSTLPPLRVVDGPIRLRTAGDTRLRLRLVDHDGDRAVRIARVG